MKNLILILIVFGLAGCAPVLQTVYRMPGQTEETRTLYLRITSEPKDADIYINDRLVGTTASADALASAAPLFVKYRCVMNPFGWRECTPVEQYLIRVSKPGYKDVMKNITFNKWEDGTPNGFYVPGKTTYHFKLEPKEAQSHSEPVSSPSVSGGLSSTEATSHDLRLDGIIYEKGTPCAIINGKVLKIGDRINDNLVVDIKTDTVILYDGKSNFELEVR